MISNWGNTLQPLCVNHGPQRRVAYYHLITDRMKLPVCQQCARDHEMDGDTVKLIQ